MSEPDAPEWGSSEEPAETAADIRPLVVFELGGELYGVAITDVREIRELSHVTPVPYVRPYVLGLVNVHGAILPVVDLRRKFGLDLGHGGPASKLIVLAGQGYQVALWADAVRGLERIPLARFQSVPAGVARVGAEYYDHVVVIDGRMMAELNVRRMLADTGAAGTGGSVS